MSERIRARSGQTKQLRDLFAAPTEALPDALYLHGCPSTGKSLVLNTVLKEAHIPTATVNLVECYTSRILFENILRKFCKLPEVKCDNMMDFIANLQNSAPTRGVLVLDKADKLRTMEANLLPAFFRLRELTGLGICVVFISELILQKFYTKVNILEPIKIAFPQYSKDELVEILAMDDESELYRSYLNVFLSVFYRNCRDLSELRYIASNYYPEYCKPLQEDVQDQMKLWRNIAPKLKLALDHLYLRTSTIESCFVQNLELPFYAKYLLIAAYLASYNPAKDDKRLFMKYHGKKTKTMRDVKKKNIVEDKLNTQLGPKPFGFDRLLAIFYSILDDKVGFNNNLLVQVSSLVELQLLTKLSDDGNLDGVKYKCNVDFDFVQNVAKMVGFNVRKYLSDFSHM